ncbi:MAG: sulfatase, partial [Planctomycetaceae bacterium]|nr:sulfatase [Planctomycetaceae bacterium]
MNETQLIFFSDSRVPEEFYDLENDPHEIHNLANDPAHRQALEEHRKMLASWIAETGDKGQEPESEIGLRCVLQRWGELCVNPEYDAVRKKMQRESKKP